MAKRKPSNLLARFRQRLTRLEQLRVKEEELYSKGLITQRDIEEIYGMTFLNTVVHFEELIEELFISFLVGRSKPACPEFKVRVSIKSHKVARELLFQDRNYVRWLPYDNTKKWQEHFFEVGGHSQG